LNPSLKSSPHFKSSRKVAGEFWPQICAKRDCARERTRVEKLFRKALRGEEKKDLLVCEDAARGKCLWRKREKETDDNAGECGHAHRRALLSGGM